MRQCVKLCAIWSNHCGDMAVFRFFKMASVHHLGFVVAFSDHPRSIVGGLYCCAKFIWNRLCSFEDMRLSMLCEFGLKMPIHVFWG